MTIQKLKIKSTPYTYILEWTKQGKRYIGARWAIGCHPNDLWSSYFTSSKYVTDFVKCYGAPDIILIDKAFDNSMDAMNREQELQYKFDVRNNDSFLNKAIGGVWDHRDPEVVKRMSDSHKGKKHSPQWIAWVTEFHRTRKRSKETCEKIRQSNTGKTWSEERKRQASVDRTGKSSKLKGRNLSEDHAAKSRIAMLGKKHSEETKAKMRAAHAERLKDKSQKEK